MRYVFFFNSNAKAKKKAIPSPLLSIRTDLFVLFYFFPTTPRASNPIVTNCLTAAVAQVNCTSITAVACYCTNQYASCSLLTMSASHHVAQTTIERSPMRSLAASQPTAVGACPQQRRSPSNSVPSTTPRSPSRPLPGRPHRSSLPTRRRRRPRPPQPIRNHLTATTELPQRCGYSICAGGPVWRLLRVVPCLAGHFYNPVKSSATVFLAMVLVS